MISRFTAQAIEPDIQKTMAAMMRRGVDRDGEFMTAPEQTLGRL
jgi:hypothetical protein